MGAAWTSLGPLSPWGPDWPCVVGRWQTMVVALTQERPISLMRIRRAPPQALSWHY